MALALLEKGVQIKFTALEPGNEGQTSDGCANSSKGSCEISISKNLQTEGPYGTDEGVDPDILAIAPSQIAITLAHESYHAINGRDPDSLSEEYTAYYTETLVRLEMEAQGIEYSSLKYSKVYDINSFTDNPSSNTLIQWFTYNNKYYIDNQYPVYP